MLLGTAEQRALDRAAGLLSHLCRKYARISTTIPLRDATKNPASAPATFEFLRRSSRSGLSRSGFGVEFEFLLYDVTSTYVEGPGAAQRGGRPRLQPRAAPRLQAGQYRSRVTPEGLPLGYKVLPATRRM